MVYAEDGDLSKYTESQILGRLDNVIPPNTLFNHFMTAGWIDEDRKLHDWFDFAGRYLTARYHTNNPNKLNKIRKKYKSALRRTKGPLKSLYHTIPNHTKPTIGIGIVRQARPENAEDVKNYFINIGSTAEEGQQFWDYQTAKGWKIGRESMKDWKAACRYWVKNGFKKPATTQDGRYLTKTQQHNLAALDKWKEKTSNEARNDDQSNLLPDSSVPGPEN